MAYNMPEKSIFSFLEATTLQNIFTSSFIYYCELVSSRYARKLDLCNTYMYIHGPCIWATCLHVSLLPIFQCENDDKLFWAGDNHLKYYDSCESSSWSSSSAIRITRCKYRLHMITLLCQDAPDWSGVDWASHVWAWKTLLWPAIAKGRM